MIYDNGSAVRSSRSAKGGIDIYLAKTGNIGLLAFTCMHLCITLFPGMPR